MKVLLYGTEHCALCERALDLLVSMPEMRLVTLEVVDVADSPALEARYGARLPVVAVGRRELDWPFDPAGVADALSAARADGAS